MSRTSYTTMSMFFGNLCQNNRRRTPNVDIVSIYLKSFAAFFNEQYNDNNRHTQPALDRQICDKVGKDKLVFPINVITQHDYSKIRLNTEKKKIACLRRIYKT